MKYELTNIKRNYGGTTVYRIKALEDIENKNNFQLDVKKGDLGGWVSGYHNLSQQGKCWIYDNSIVVDNARVEDDAIIYGNSAMYDNSSAYNRSEVCNSVLSNNSMILGKGCIEDCELHNNVKIMKNSRLIHSFLFGNTQIKVEGYNILNCWIYNSYIINKVKIINATVGNSIIKENGQIYMSDIYNSIIAKYASIFFSSISNMKFNNEENFTGITLHSMSDINNKKSMLFYQCNLFPEDDYVIAYKLVNEDFSSIHDSNFFYKIGEIIEEPNTDSDESKSCAEGLHFSSPNYWIKNRNVFKKQLVLKAKIKLDDIVSIQNGKIRCKRAEILSYFEV